MPESQRIVLGALHPAVQRVAALPPLARVVIVASGDPLFFGVVRALRAQGLRPEVVTAPSSVATAFASVGLPWDDAVVVSVHGRPLARAVNLARELPKVAVFTSAENGIRELAAGLAGLNRWFVLAERLGESDEQVRVFDATAALSATPVEPNIVLVLATHPDSPDAVWSAAIAGPTRTARPAVSAAAAVVFARLLPEPGELLIASGPLGADVAALTRWAQAAVVTEPVGAVPDVVLAPAEDALAACASRPRAVALTGKAAEELPEGYVWTSEVIEGHHLTTGVRS